MSVAKQSVICPYCKEQILAGATRCKHCQAELIKVDSKKSRFAGYNTFRTGFLVGVLFTIVVTILGYLTFKK
jgi:predicted amidophosphoribosyltransferase